MSGSSGQLVTTTIRDVECDGTVTQSFPLFSHSTFEHSWPCEFTGEVDVDVDPEIQVAEWDCPRCGTKHEIDWDEFTS